MTDLLSNHELLRYDRHLRLPQVGQVGQRRLRDTSVLIVGMGGLGSPLSLYLAAAGLGRLGLVDFDRVEETNLQRQVIYGSQDVGMLKTEAAAHRLNDLNPNVELDIISSRLSSENARGIVSTYDIVVDGSDNFATRYLVNDVCVLTDTPNVYGSISQFEGQVSVFAAPNGPCYQCLYEQPPPSHLVPSCAEGGVLGVLPGLVGSLQATEVLKMALGIGESLVGRLLLVDALTMQFHSLTVAKNPDCPVCGEHPSITDLIDYDAFCAASDGESSRRDIPELDVHDFKARLDLGDRPLVLDVRSANEYEESNLDGTLIPLSELPERLSELHPHQNDALIVVHCRSGARSTKAVELLHRAGFVNAVSLRGGIQAWASAFQDVAGPITDTNQG